MEHQIRTKNNTVEIFVKKYWELNRELKLKNEFIKRSNMGGCNRFPIFRYWPFFIPIIRYSRFFLPIIRYFANLMPIIRYKWFLLPIIRYLRTFRYPIFNNFCSLIPDFTHFFPFCCLEMLFSGVWKTWNDKIFGSSSLTVDLNPKRTRQLFGPMPNRPYKKEYCL